MANIYVIRNLLSACVFHINTSANILTFGNRFPTLNRWIQTQAKIQYLSGVPMLRRNGFVDGHKKAGLLKRSREDEIDIDSEEEDVAHTVHVRNSNCENLENLIDSSMAYDDIMMRKVSSKKDNLDSRNSASLFFEWENESIYEEAVQRLIFFWDLLMFFFSMQHLTIICINLNNILL